MSKPLLDIKPGDYLMSTDNWHEGKVCQVLNILPGLKPENPIVFVSDYADWNKPQDHDEAFNSVDTDYTKTLWSLSQTHIFFTPDKTPLPMTENDVAKLVGHPVKFKQD